jgi:hypothetical protein
MRPITANQTSSTTGIWMSGLRSPSQRKKLLSENPMVVGRASSTGGRVTRNRISAATRTNPIATTSRVTRRLRERPASFASECAVPVKDASVASDTFVVSVMDAFRVPHRTGMEPWPGHRSPWPVIRSGRSLAASGPTGA